jgi:hypothetical protein
MDAQTALLTVLDQVDYTNGACGPTEMVAAVLPREVIKLAREAAKSGELSEMTEFEKFHPRAVKLLRKRKGFIVIAEDEPYYMTAYNMIRNDQQAKGEWIEIDEQNYQEEKRKFNARLQLEIDDFEADIMQIEEMIDEDKEDLAKLTGPDYKPEDNPDDEFRDRDIEELNDSIEGKNREIAKLQEKIGKLKARMKI